MTPGPPAAIAPGATSQLGALLATLAGAMLVAGLLPLARWLRRGRRAAPPAGTAGPTGTGPSFRAAAVRRLLGAVLLIALVLPTAAAIRQLWPHPDLGARLLVVWLPLLLLPVAVWLAARGGDQRGGWRP